MTDATHQTDLNDDDPQLTAVYDANGATVGWDLLSIVNPDDATRLRSRNSFLDDPPELTVGAKFENGETQTISIPLTEDTTVEIHELLGRVLAAYRSQESRDNPDVGISLRPPARQVLSESLVEIFRDSPGKALTTLGIGIIVLAAIVISIINIFL